MMAAHSQTYIGSVGGLAIFVLALLYVKIISVHREGLEYDVITTGEPGNREVLYTPSTGELRFQNLFVGGTITGGLGFSQSKEKIHVIWED